MILTIFSFYWKKRGQLPRHKIRKKRGEGARVLILPARPDYIGREVLLREMYST